MYGVRRVRALVSDRRHQTAPAGPDKKIVTLSYAACIQCRACVAECPEQAVSVSHDVEVAAYTRQQLARTASFDVDPATGRGTFVQVEAHQGPTLHESADRLRDRIRADWGARFMCARWTREAATAARWRLRRRRTRSMTWNASEFISSPVPGMRTCCWSPVR